MGLLLPSGSVIELAGVSAPGHQSPAVTPGLFKLAERRGFIAQIAV